MRIDRLLPRESAAPRKRATSPRSPEPQQTGPVAIRSHHDDAAAVFVLLRHLLLAADRRGVDFTSIVTLDAPDFSQHLGLSQAAPEGAWRTVRANLAVVREGRPDEARACGARRQQDQSQRVEAQGDELRTQGEACRGAGSRVAKWLSGAEAADAAEDKLHGCDKTGEEMPDWIDDKKRRAERIREAKAELEAEARAAAEGKLKATAKAQERREAEGRRKHGRAAAQRAMERRRDPNDQTDIRRTWEAGCFCLPRQYVKMSFITYLESPWPVVQFRLPSPGRRSCPPDRGGGVSSGCKSASQALRPLISKSAQAIWQFRRHRARSGHRQSLVLVIRVRHASLHEVQSGRDPRPWSSHFKCYASQLRPASGWWTRKTRCAD